MVAKHIRILVKGIFFAMNNTQTTCTWTRIKNKEFLCKTLLIFPVPIRYVPYDVWLSYCCARHERSLLIWWICLGQKIFDPLHCPHVNLLYTKTAHYWFLNYLLLLARLSHMCWVTGRPNPYSFANIKTLFCATGCLSMSCQICGWKESLADSAFYSFSNLCFVKWPASPVSSCPLCCDSLVLK